MVSCQLFLILTLREKAYVEVSVTTLLSSSSLSLSVTVIFQARGHMSVLKKPLGNKFSSTGLAAERYQEETVLLHVNQVRTPTHRVTDEIDVWVPVAQSYLSESSLHVMNVSHKMLVFSDEGHGIQNNPWHEKLKLREEMRWLNKYASVCLPPCEAFLVPPAHRRHTFIYGFIISIFARLFYLLNM